MVIFFRYLGIITSTLGHTHKLVVIWNTEDCESLKIFQNVELLKKPVWCNNYLESNTTLSLDHTSWQSLEQLNNVKASVNFNLSKAYSIQELSGDKVTQWVLKSHFSVFWRGQFPKCYLSVTVTKAPLNVSNLSKNPLFM